MVFEILMLICFGFAWPTSIYKSLTSRSVAGKSELFMYIIIAGYLFGILHKIFNNLDFVVILYAINAIMVSFDLVLFYRNKKLSQNN
jgi:cyanate permease